MSDSLLGVSLATNELSRILHLPDDDSANVLIMRIVERSIIVTNPQFDLMDDSSLLKIMLKDSKRQPPLYTPGPYWATKTTNSACEILSVGIREFRGSQNLIGMSYADNLFLDVRETLLGSVKGRFVRFLLSHYPFKNVFAAQVRWTESYARSGITYLSQALNCMERPRLLLKRYDVPFSLLGNCERKINIENKDIAIHYLDLLDQHDNASSKVDFSAASSVFEIGGGFGTNIHLLIENYENLRKVLYLDIVPNLYVGTQYLKAFYGSAVVDYEASRDMHVIKFSPNDDLEVFCIAPWQLERFEGSVDILVNSHSFVEMPLDVVQNYVRIFESFPSSGESAVVLCTYESHNPSSTLEPYKLPSCFENRGFESFRAGALIDQSRQNLYFISPGRFARQANQ